MSSVVISGDSSGTVTLTVPSAAGTNTATLPAATGTVMVSGNMPAFSAYNSSTQAISSGVYTKVQFNTKEFDTASCYDNTTNYRFTPNVAGYYQVTGSLIWQASGASATNGWLIIYKNGSAFKNGAFASSTYGFNVDALVYLNGSTDYIELYAYQGTGQTNDSGANKTWFQAAMVRSA